MSSKRFFWIGLLAAALVLLLALPVLAEATNQTGAPCGNMGFGRGFGGGFNFFRTAEELGITSEEMEQGRSEGKTLAQIAEAKGISRETLISKIVESVKTQVEQMVDQVPGRGMPPFRLNVDVAEILGISQAELRQAMGAGKTLAQIAQEKGISRETLISKLAEAEKTQIQQAVTDGKLAQEQADKLLENLTDRITNMVDNICGGPGREPVAGKGFGRRGCGKGFGRGFGNPANNNSDTSTGKTQ